MMDVLMGNTAIKIFICAGEVSGDMHGAYLMRALRAHSPSPIAFRGFGGDAMKAEGAEILYHTDQTAVVGLTPVLRSLPFFVRMARRLKREMLAWRPDAVLTIDYTGMNLRLAAFAHAHGLRTVHYVCPQVWAWRRGRIPGIARCLDQLLCFFPFEPELFDGTPLRAEFIGHPLVDEIAKTLASPPAPLPWQGQHRVALLPGSRAGEITRLLPRLLAAAALLEERLGGDCSFIIPAPTPKMRALGEQVAAAAAQRPRHLAFVDGQAREVLRQANAAAVASGTATLEACMVNCPTVLVYGASRLTYWVARRVITGVRHLGLANILAKREVMPELLQDNFTPERTAEILHRYLTDASARATVVRDLRGTARLLGTGDAATRAAKAILGNL
ncbi:MAG: lipid-A-disaccharide synthase [Kiritimatiellaeota bacterium]|nr:lipid-A-disaccharide synthase [Kiritimatiellota bacterium]